MIPHLKLFTGMFLLLIASGTGFTQTKPSVDAEMIVDYLPSPTTLDESVQSSDAVVLGSIRTVRTYQPPIAYASVRKTERDFPRFTIGHQYLMFLLNMNRNSRALTWAPRGPKSDPLLRRSMYR